MSSEKASDLPAAAFEIAALITTLQRTERRLEDLTAGEVDVVLDSEGRAFFLRRTQDELRHRESARQAAILNALPTHIALLDGNGLIVSVNQAWQAFAVANGLLQSNYGIGASYLGICDDARGDGADDARQAAKGIRTVLRGGSRSYSLEYPCNSPTANGWMLLTVTALADGNSGGAVVMHLDVTAERRTQHELRASELRFRQMAENIGDVFYLRDAQNGDILYVSPAYETIWGNTCESLYADQETWVRSIHPDDRAAAIERRQNLSTLRGFEVEYRIVRPDGSIRWILARGFPVRDDSGTITRIAGTAEDITERKLAERALRDSESRFSSMLQNVELAAVMLDRTGRMTYSNDAFLRMSGWPREELIGGDWFELFAPLDQVRRRAAFDARVADRSAAWHGEFSILTRSGEPRLILWNHSLLYSASGDVLGTASIGQDVTEKRQAETRLKRLNRVYAVLSGINSLIVRVRDREELFRSACEIAIEHGEFKMAWIGIVDRTAASIVTAATAVAQSRSEALNGEHAPCGSAMPLQGNSKAAHAVREKKPVITNTIDGDTTIVRSNERIARGIFSMATLPLLIAGEAVGVLTLYSDEVDFFDAEEMRLLLGLAGDIAFAMDHIEKQERLDYLAYYDVLTGLANRHLFVDRVAQHMRAAASRGHQLAVFMIDLERFKNINDSFGQLVGDELLRQVAAWFRHNVHDELLLARLGADHFAAVMPEVAKSGDLARLVESKLASFLEHPFGLNDGVFRIAAKVGIAVYPDDGNTAESLLNNAEAALKKAKASGNRYLFYTQKMTAAVATRLTLENRLRQAIERQEFVLHYQPKLDLKTGKLVGAEALIRWNDPKAGLVPPGEFIPILEETGLIFEVGKWALNQAIEDYLRWSDAGLAAVRLAVNVSPLQLRQRAFVAEVESVIGVDARAPAGLELEITESLIMEDVNHSIASLQAIRAMGIEIAIDDFGTGFSSLSYLARLPIDTLKIDRSFIVAMISGPQGVALVSAIINVGQSLKLNVVAEGVETEEQSRLLRLLKCNQAQGFLFSKAVPAEQFAARFLAAPE
jgi:diguanylate cyclase (GGDEF)-like protein/PAS domain S-box-containing protein